MGIVSKGFNHMIFTGKPLVVISAIALFFGIANMVSGDTRFMVMVQAAAAITAGAYGLYVYFNDLDSDKTVENITSMHLFGIGTTIIMIFAPLFMTLLVFASPVGAIWWFSNNRKSKVRL